MWRVVPVGACLCALMMCVCVFEERPLQCVKVQV